MARWPAGIVLAAGVIVSCTLMPDGVEARLNWCPPEISDGRTTIPLNLRPPEPGVVDDVVDGKYKNATVRSIKCYYGGVTPDLKLVVTWLNQGWVTSDKTKLPGTCGPTGGPSMSSRTHQARVDWNGRLHALAPSYATTLLQLAEAQAQSCQDPFTAVAPCNEWQATLVQRDPPMRWTGKWLRPESFASQGFGYTAHWQQGVDVVTQQVLPLDETASFYTDAPAGRLLFINDQPRTAEFSHIGGQVMMQLRDGSRVAYGTWEARCQRR